MCGFSGGVTNFQIRSRFSRLLSGPHEKFQWLITLSIERVSVSLWKTTSNSISLLQQAVMTKHQRREVRETRFLDAAFLATHHGAIRRQAARIAKSSISTFQYRLERRNRPPVKRRTLLTESEEENVCTEMRT